MRAKQLLISLAILLQAAVMQAQGQISINGRVLDADGLPVIGAAIFVEGSSNGTTSDVDGQFSLTVPSGGTSLVASCLGYDDKKVALAANQSNVTIYLAESSTLLSETVVVGYGSQKKINLTGAITTVSSKDLQDRTALDVAHMLQGAVPGLNVTSASGRPGQSAALNIRGLNSINGGSPLVLIDGTEGDLQRVNPADVESISVVKDASSAAIYGARASAGVILVTTKGGSSADGKTTVRYSGRFGWTSPTTSTDYETRGYYSVYLNNLFFSSYAGTPYATYSEQDMVELYNRRYDVVEDPSRPWVVIDQRNGINTYNYYANTDWYHELFRDNKPTTSHSISFSGGTKKFKYLLSGSFNREEGVFRKHPDVYKKFTLRSKMSFEVNKWMSVSNNTSYFKSGYDYPGVSGVNNQFSNATAHALASYPVMNPDGTSIYTTQYNSYALMDGEAVILNQDKHYNNDNADNISTTTEITLTPLRQLQVKANYTYMFNNARNVNRSVNGEYSKTPGVIEVLNTGKWENKLYEVSNVHQYQSVNAYATYADTFAEAHNLKVTAGMNWEYKYLKDVKATGWNLLSDTLHDLNLVGTDSEGQRQTEVGGGQNEYATLGFFARVNYDYLEKYLFELTGRYDGSSRFAASHRWGFFPSASAGWKISSEPFFAPVKDWWNLAKLRFSYGRLGNQQVGYYDYIRTITTSTSSYLFGGSKPTVAAIGAPVASDLTWETVSQYNLGADFAFLDNRLNFSLEAYIRDTKDMLTAGIALPAVYGASSPKMNSADLRTKGIELTLSWRDAFKLLGETFNYGVTATFSDYLSKITKFDNPEKAFAKNYYVGMTYGEIWGYHIDGIFATDEEAKAWDVNQDIVNGIINTSAGAEKGLRAGDLKYADLDGNKVISTGKGTVNDPGDRRIIGNSQPRFNYGLTLNASWMGIDLSVFFQGIGKMDWYPAADARSFWGPFARPYMTFIPKNFHTMYWTEENPDAYFPRPRGYVAMNTSRELGAVNDRYLQNIGYCRLKNLTIGYSLPSNLLAKAKIDGLRFYFSGENLGVLSGIHSDYIDPEMAMTNGNLRIYPWQKTFMFGIDLTF